MRGGVCFEGQSPLARLTQGPQILTSSVSLPARWHSQSGGGGSCMSKYTGNWVSLEL